MPNYVVTYDLNTVHIRRRGQHRATAYRLLGNELNTRGWNRYQKSSFWVRGKTAFRARQDVSDIADEIEQVYGQGAFTSLTYHQYVEFISERP
jgi:hypothetical protein